MKKILIIALLTSLAFSLSAQKMGDQLTFSSKDWQGKPVTEAIFAQSQLTMLNIWGTFCSPCIKEIPDLEKLSQANKDKGVQIIGLPLDLSDRKGQIIPSVKEDADLILSKSGASYTQILPNLSLTKGGLKDVQALPTTIFLDEKGIIVSGPHYGAKSQSEWQKIIDEVLSGLKEKQ